MTGERLVALIALLAPAYGANMAPPFARFWQGWNPPILRRALGGHKTVVGTAAGLVAGPGAGLRRLDVAAVLGLGFVGALAVDRVAYRLGIKTTKW